MVIRIAWLTVALIVTIAPTTRADAPKRVLLIGQGPDGHPVGTHEFMAGLTMLKAVLDRQGDISTKLVKADEPWREGPELIADADAVVVYLSEGAKWFRASPQRLKALRSLCERKGGIVALHWAIGAKDAEHIDDCLRLIGGCHGGPDRKYVKTQAKVRIADHALPITFGIEDFDVRDEFYYRLKFVKPRDGVRPVLEVTLDGAVETVCWAWERPDGGRSFGFSGAHYHNNWERTEYRRLAAQAVRWTLGLDVPREGVAVELREGDLIPIPEAAERQAKASAPKS